MLLTDALFLDYRRCPRRAFLNFYNSVPRDPEKPFLTRLRQQNAAQVQDVLKNFYPYASILSSAQDDLFSRAKETEILMQQGVDCIYNGILLTVLTENTKVTLLGNPHFLVKASGNSKWGDWSYVPINVQLGQKPKLEYKLIASFYAYLLAKIQGILPVYSELILRQKKFYKVNLVDWIAKLEEVLAEYFLNILQQEEEPELFISRQNCSLCHWYSHCYSTARTQKHLSLIPGVSPSRYKLLQSQGIFTLDSLANSSHRTLETILGWQVASDLQLQARSIVENKAFIKSNCPKLTLKKAAWEFYFDIEAEPELDLQYLLGVLLVNTTTNEYKYYPLLAESPEHEVSIWQNFLDLTNEFPTAPIFHYSAYEIEALKKLASRYDTQTKTLHNLIDRCIDLHLYITRSVIMPVENYSLKSLANWLGFFWREPGFTGEECVCWYDNWLKTGERSFLDSILNYNEDDCLATYKLKTWFFDFRNSLR